MTKLKSIFIVVAGATAMFAEATTNTVVTAEMKTGETQSYIIKEDGKMDIEGRVLVIKTDSDAQKSMISISDIKKVTLTKNSTEGIDIVGSDNAEIYPNPATDIIYIALKDANDAIVTIYDAEGKSVLGAKIKNGGSVDISSLAKGVYMVSVNGSTYKINKL